MQAEVFLDSAFAIALAASSDQLHSQAVSLAGQLKAEKPRLVTTQAILLEIGNALAKQRYRAAAVQLLASLENDPSVEIIPLSPELYAEAFRLYKARPDKEWGMTDCVSFVIMGARGITEALTSDGHFAQAGYNVLLHRT